MTASCGRSSPRCRSCSVSTSMQRSASVQGGPLQAVCVLRQSPRCSSLRRQVAPKLAALRTESDSGFCRAELAAKVLARPTLLLGLEETCPR